MKKSHQDKMKQQILGFMAILYFLFSNFNGLILMEQQNYSALFIKRKFRFLVDVILRVYKEGVA